MRLGGTGIPAFSGSVKRQNLPLEPLRELPVVRLALGWWRELWHGGLPPRSPLSFVFALACVAIATLVRIGLGEISSASAVFAPYYSATLVAALVGGWRAGAVAAVSGALAALWLFVPADWQSHAFDREWFVSYLLFATSSVVIVWAAESYRDLLWRLREEQDRRALLNHELAHRIRNTLTIVQSIIGQTLRDQPAALVKLNDRIAALAATNDLLVKSEWRGASVTKILSGEFAPYDPARFRLDGADFECPAEAATVLALMFHELTTNAAKYGALSAPHGRIMLIWTKRGERVDFDWAESGGPQPITRRREGFGSTLLRRGLQQFDGAVDMQFEPNGLHCKLALTLPTPRHREDRDLEAKRPRAASISRPPADTNARSTALVIRPPRVAGQK
jgi:two-component sensor histidine kinase